MKPIRCFLVDDEPPAIALLEQYCNMIEGLELVGSSQSAVKAYGQLEKKQVELLFLDIRMPVLNGIDFLKSLQQPPAVILTTAYREYAIEGYDLDIIDYLLKPISFDRFLKAVDRYRSRHAMPDQPAATPVQTPPDHLFFTVDRSKHKVVIDDIIFLESLKDYVRIHTKTERLVVKGNLGTILKLLPPAKFIRTHRSYAAAIEHITAFNTSNVNLIGSNRIPIGMSYRREFLNGMKQDH